MLFLVLVLCIAYLIAGFCVIAPLMQDEHERRIDPISKLTYAIYLLFWPFWFINPIVLCEIEYFIRKFLPNDKK